MLWKIVIQNGKLPRLGGRVQTITSRFELIQERNQGIQKKLVSQLTKEWYPMCSKSIHLSSSKFDRRQVLQLRKLSCRKHLRLRRLNHSRHSWNRSCAGVATAMVIAMTGAIHL